MYAAKTRTSDETAVNRATWPGFTSPCGRARMLVRGFAASKVRSAQRLNPMAADRAPTMATVIQRIVRHDGRPPAASRALVNAKGSAKMVCSNLIISRMILILFSMRSSQMNLTTETRRHGERLVQNAEPLQITACYK